MLNCEILEVEETTDNISQLISDNNKSTSKIDPEKSDISMDNVVNANEEGICDMSENSDEVIDNESTASTKGSDTPNLSENDCDDMKEESSDSTEETPLYNVEDSANDDDNLYNIYRTIRIRARNNNPELPSTVTKLMTKDGAPVYIVGTAHFSIESQEDVSKLPNHKLRISLGDTDGVTTSSANLKQSDKFCQMLLFLNCAKARMSILDFDEETMMKEAANINFDKLRESIRQNGLFQGLMYILLLSLSAKVTKSLGMAPGGEFRRAVAERLIIDGLEDDSDLDDDSSESSAQECDVSYQNHADESSDDNFDDMPDGDVPTADISQPLSHSVSPDISPRSNDCWQEVGENDARKNCGCIIQLGDRPIHITIKRALATISWSKSFSLAWRLLFTDDNITPEDVEKCKESDLMEKMMSDMTGQYPVISKVFIEERDKYLAYQLEAATHAVAYDDPSEFERNPTVVVGVVGIGHLPGIVANWGTVTSEDIAPLLTMPEKSKLSRCLKFGIRISFVSLAVFGLYKVMPSTVKDYIPPMPSWKSLISKLHWRRSFTSLLLTLYTVICIISNCEFSVSILQEILRTLKIVLRELSGALQAMICTIGCKILCKTSEDLTQISSDDSSFCIFPEVRGCLVIEQAHIVPRLFLNAALDNLNFHSETEDGGNVDAITNIIYQYSRGEETADCVVRVPYNPKVRRKTIQMPEKFQLAVATVLSKKGRRPDHCVLSI
ncbi:TraB domain-containing protein [Nymphon striatum]|nr:TraB domain-containing protein [Nymphon striatum]